MIRVSVEVGAGHVGEGGACEEHEVTWAKGNEVERAREEWSVLVRIGGEREEVVRGMA